MATKIIRPGSVSFDQILEDLSNYVRINSEGGWKDFAVSSAGNVVMELLSGLGSFLHHDVLTARRETVLETAKLRSSIVGMAQLMGYPVRRKSAPKLRMTITPQVSGPISRSDIIGSFRSLSIVPLKDYYLTAGVENTIYCAIGEWKEHSFALQVAGDFSKYLIRNASIENDLVFNPIENVEMPLIQLDVASAETVGTESVEYTPINLVEYAEQLDRNSSLIKTHLDGIILIFGDNIFGRRATLSDIFRFTYLTTQGLLETPSISELEAGFTCDVGVINRVELIYPGSNEDSLEKIRLALTQYNAARRRMVTIDDHKSILMSYKGVISSNAQRSDTGDEGGCCAVDMSCLLEGGARLDEASNVVLDPSATQNPITIQLNDTVVVYQSSDLHPSSVVLPQTGFVSSLSTGTRVWLKVTSNGDPADVPQGLDTEGFYYIIRIPNSQNIRFATNKFKAAFGIFTQINPPVSGNVIDCNLELSIHQDTTKTRDPLSPTNVVYETEANISSSLRVSYDFFENLNTSDAIFISYSDEANQIKNLENNSYYYAIRLAIGESYRVRFALDGTRAELGDRVLLDHPQDGQPASGTVTINRRRHREELTIGTSNVFFDDPEDDTEWGYIDLANASDTIKDMIHASAEPIKVTIRIATGGTVLPGGLQNGKTYWIFNPQDYRISFADSKINAEANIGIPLTVPTSDVVGKIFLDLFHPEEEEIDIAPESLNVVYESAYSYASSIDFTSDPYWINDNGINFFAGMKVRLYSDGTVKLPTGLESGEFYYAIPIPGTNRVRFAESFDKAVGTDNVEVEYIPLYPPSVGELGGFLLMDCFLDNTTIPLKASNIFYNQIADYLNSINVGSENRLVMATGYPYGYPTGTKLKLSVGETTPTLPIGLSVDSFYYLIRIPGSSNVRFATTRSRAMRGLAITLAEGEDLAGEVEVTIYGTPEEDALREYLEDFRVAGEQIFFVDPVDVTLDIKMNVVIDSSSSHQLVLDKIEEVLSSYTNQLSSVFNIGRVTKELNEIPEILRLYIERPLSDYRLAFNEYLTLSANLKTSEHIVIHIGESSFIETPTIDLEEKDGFEYL